MIRSVDRAVAILDLLASAAGRETADHRDSADFAGLSGAEVARDLGVHRSTALRLLGTLERHALVERDGRSAKYRLGRRLPQLARVVTGELDLRHVARPVCEALAASTGETVTLDVLDGDEIVPIEQSTGSSSFVSVNWLGRRTPAHCTASGKVILAFAPEPNRRRLLSGQLKQRTPRSIVDLDELEKQLAAAREAGYALTFEELEVGLDAIAAPVFSADGEVVAAIDVSGPAHRLQAGGAPAFVSLTREAAADLSRRLGFRGHRSRQGPST